MTVERRQQENIARTIGKLMFIDALEAIALFHIHNLKEIMLVRSLVPATKLFYMYFKNLLCLFNNHCMNIG